MDEQAVRDRAQALCDALESGNVDAAIEEFSPELRRNVGEVLALLPLPANEVAIDSIGGGGTGFDVVIRLAGEVDEVMIQTRWKDRDGRPTMVEASHLSKTERAAPDEDGDADRDSGDSAPA